MRENYGELRQEREIYSSTVKDELDYLSDEILTPEEPENN
jgi:hypothetical protein